MTIEFSLNSPSNFRRAFLDHLARFARQDRDVSWQSAPEVFASTYGRRRRVDRERASRRHGSSVRQRRAQGRAPAERLEQVDRGQSEREGQQPSDHDAQAGCALRNEDAPERLCSGAHAARRTGPLDTRATRRYLTEVAKPCPLRKSQ